MLAFVQATFSSYRADPVHELIAAYLDRVVAGELHRLMIFAPPQHGKSQLVSVHLPAFWLGRRPDDPVIITSYGADLAESKSREARDLVTGYEFRQVFPEVRLADDSRAVNEWMLAKPHRGKVVAAGVGGPVTGRGGLLGIIDDPHANWEQAQSLTMRNRIWDWYKGTFRTRIWEHGAIVIVLTRWHEDDLAGRLLSDQASEWTVLRLPALAETQEQRDAVAQRWGLVGGQLDPLGREPNEPLAPSRFSRQALLSIQRDVGTLVWSAEYQGSPTQPEGTMFKRAWFKIVNSSPLREGDWVRYWDKAATEDGGAYTCGVLMQRAINGKLYVVDLVRGQWSEFERETVIKQTAELDRDRYGLVNIWTEQEPGSGGKDSALATIRNLTGFAARADRPTGDKAVRANPLAAQAEAGNVHLVRAYWNSSYLDELAAFPNSKYKDQVDASSGALSKLAGVSRAGMTKAV